VNRSTSASSYGTEIGNTTTTSFTDNVGLVADTSYYYWIRAYNAFGQSDYSGYDTGYMSSTGDGDGDGDGDGGGCFIATATYGSPMHPYVETLRDFRDKYLVSNKVGREFVDYYYKYSPSVANIIARSKPLKVIVRIHLVPIIVLSYSMVHFGPIATGVILVLILILPIFLILFHRRN